MTFEQGAIVAILLVMLAAYASERVRVEVVAMSGLAAVFALGLVAPDRLFTGFSSPAVITVVEVLIVSSALAQTRMMDGIARRIIATGAGERAVIGLLCAIGGGISVFINNIGALALVFPVAASVCERMRIAPARMYMALSFATLLGGMCSLTGTPANLLVNEWVVRETGGSLAYFATGAFGFPLLVTGIALVTLVAPLVFRGEAAAGEDAERGAGFVAERAIPRHSPLAGRAMTAWEAASGIAVHGVVRGGVHVFARRGDIVFAPGDVVLVEGAYGDLIEAEERGELARVPGAQGAGEAETLLEFIVMPESLLVGSRVEDIAHYAPSGVEVHALATRRGRIEGRFCDLQISTGDILMVAGGREDLRLLAGECGLLMLTPRRRLRPSVQPWIGAALFAAGVLATAFDLLATEVAFGAVILIMVATRQLNLRTTLQDLNWTIVVLLACMIPIGQAVETTGAAALIADTVAGWLPGGGGMVVAVVMLVVAVMLTPFIDNVSTAAVLSPIAAGLASRTGTPPELLLTMVAIGASIDFLTPFGHHNNTIVMGAGGYRFRDFARLGAPLTLMCVALVAALLMVGVR